MDWIGRGSFAGASRLDQSKPALAPGGITAGEVITFHTNYAGVEGYAGSNSDLRLELERLGAPVGRMNFRSDGVGHFYAQLINAGKRATVEAGDQLTVLVDGTTTLDLTVPEINGTVYVVTDTIIGQISGVTWPAALRVSSYGNSFAAVTDASGYFTVSLASKVDLMWDSWVGVAYQTEPGLWVARYFFPQDGFVVRGTYSKVRGYTDPGINISVDVNHNGSTASQTVKSQQTDGFWEATFEEFPLIDAGDLVAVSINGGLLQATVADLSAAPDMPNDDVNGNGPLSSNVTAYAELGDGLIWYNSYQRANTNPGNGSFTASFPDGSLNTLFACYVVHHTAPHADSWIAVPSPLARADWMFNRAFGFAQPSSEVVVTLRDSVGGLLESKNVTASENDGQFIYTFLTDFKPDYQLTFNGGGLGLTYNLVTLTVGQDLLADDVLGQSPADDSLYIFTRGGVNQGNFIKYIPANLTGEYLDDLSGIQDQYNGGMASASYPEGDNPDQPAWQRNGQNAPFIGLNESHNGLWGSVPAPHVPVTLTLQKGLNTYTAYAQSDGWGNFDWTRFNNGSIDIAPGDQVIVAIDGWSQAITAPDLDIFINAELDRVTGIGPANSFVEVYTYENNSSLRVPTDASGNFLADYSGIVDLIGGSQVEVGFYDANWNFPHAWSQAPFARANTTWDAVDGFFGLNVSVQYTVTTPLGVLKGGGIGATNQDGWLNGIWCGQLTGSCDLLPGDRVTVTTDTGFETVMVPISINGQMNVNTEQISGQMVGGVFPAQGEYGVWSTARQEGYGGSLSIDAGGNYQADVSAFGLQVGDEAEIWYIDQNGNRLGIQLYTLRLDVNYGHNWVEVQANPGTNVSIEVQGKSSITGIAEGDGWFRTHQHNVDWDSGQPDIQIGDNVFVTAGDYTASVQPVGQIDGQLDLNQDLVTGKLTAAHFTGPLRVACEVWVEPWPRIELAAVDPSGGPESEFTCDFGAIGWDLRPRQDVALVYYEPDGNRVINMLNPLYARAHSTYDLIDGWFGPNVTVAFTVTTGLGEVKGRGSGQAKPDGWMDGIWCGQLTGACDLLPGDRVTVTTNTGFETVMVPISINGQMNVNTEQISGQMVGGAFPAQGEYWVWSPVRQEGYGGSFSIQAGGNYQIDVSAFGLQDGDEAEIWYIDQNGNWLGVQLFTLRLDVNYGHNWVEVQANPGTSVVIMVQGKSSINGTIGGDGWFRTHQHVEDWDNGQPDIQVGDVVEVVAGNFTASVDPIGQIDGELNLDANLVTGELNAAHFTEPLRVACEVWAEPWPRIEFPAINPSGGQFTCDFGAIGWDLLPRQDVALVYYEPDGNRVINMLGAPYARANIFHDSVDGWFGSNVTVAFTVTDGLGNIKGGGSGQAKPDDGWMDGIWCGQLTGDCDLQPGDRITVTTSAGFETVMMPISITLQINKNTDIVNGDMDDGVFPGKGRVEVWNHGRQEGWGLNVDVGSTGGYLANFSSKFDLQSGDMVDAWYFDENGNWLGNSMAGLRIEVNYAGDWIYAYTSPNAVLNILVDDGSQIYQLTAPANDTGRFEGYLYGEGDWLPYQPDIQPGDEVIATVTGHQATVNPVGTITGVLDVDNDTISGEINAPAWSGEDLMVSCAVWEPGGPAINLSASADDGIYFCNIGALGWDIRPRHTIAVYYYEKDGDAVINEFGGYEIFLPVMKK